MGSRPLIQGYNTFCKDWYYFIVYSCVCIRLHMWDECGCRCLGHRIERKEEHGINPCILSAGTELCATVSG